MKEARRYLLRVKPFQLMLSFAYRIARKFCGKENGFHSIVRVLCHEVLHGLPNLPQLTNLSR